MATTKKSRERQSPAEVGIACWPLPRSSLCGQQPCGPTHISILGGGLAGLAVGYYASKHGLGFTIYEAANRLGGNCITLEHGGFRFDSGAHRFHDRNPAATREVRNLLGEALETTAVPSRLYDDGTFVNFPLSPLNLLGSLGWHDFGKAVWEVLSSRLRSRQPSGDFESFALNTYGKTIAQRFLLNYSQKLWGIPCRELSPEAATKRLKGLSLKTFLVEAILGKKAKIEHLDGAFLYPSMGIGAIAQRLAERCGPENIHVDAAITRIFHDGTRVQAVEVNAKDRIDVQDVVSTLPLPHLLEMMAPSPPAEVLALARSLRFRDLILVAFFLDCPSVTEAATVYFPSAEFPFTRVCEPRHRSAGMSPPRRTSLVAEIPCEDQDVPRHGAAEAELVETVRSRLIQVGWIRQREILDSTVVRMKYAYPVLALDAQETIRKIHSFLDRFANLTVTGRNGTFQHASIHDIIGLGEQVVRSLISRPRQ